MTNMTPSRAGWLRHVRNAGTAQISYPSYIAGWRKSTEFRQDIHDMRHNAPGGNSRLLAFVLLAFAFVGVFASITWLGLTLNGTDNIRPDGWVWGIIGTLLGILAVPLWRRGTRKDKEFLAAMREKWTPNENID